MSKHRRGQSSNPLSAIPEQTCILGDFEKHTLPTLANEVRNEFARLDNEFKHDQARMSLWSYYAVYKSNWILDLFGEPVQGSQEKAQFDGNFWSMHQWAQAIYNEECDDTKNDPLMGPALRNYVVAYNNLLKYMNVPTQQAEQPSSSQDQGKGKQPKMSEVAPRFWRH